MNKSAAIAILFYSLATTKLVAQQRNCGTMDFHNSQLISDPNYSKMRRQIEDFSQAYVQQNTGTASRSVITIPVVVHVVYNTAVQNISDAQVLSQIAVLNKDFRKLNSDWTSTPSAFQSLVADCEIEFCLAQRDPSGNPTTGITRTSTSTTVFSQTTHPATVAPIWNRDKYLNIWVCNLSGSLLGFAQLPGGSATRDGVVISYKYFGTVGTATSPYHLGRTATHEIGHWLNMLHIWGDDNGACTGSDQVNDTPNQADEHNGCPSFPQISCSNGPNGDMFMNYMDYTNDACMYMFTIGQKARMRAVLATGGFRNSLTVSNLGCIAPSNSPPIAGFTGSPTTICAGQSVTFTNTSTGNPTSYNWTFSGGTPSSSTSATPPAITYNTPGTYTVSLTVTNANGSNTSTQTNYITVMGVTAPPLIEGFENTTFPPAGWSLGNPDASVTWMRTTSASGYGTSTACASVNNYNYNGSGTRDFLYTPLLNFSSVTNGRLKWDYAYAKDANNPNKNDSLEIFYSTNCGQTWTSLWKRGGTSLATAPATGTTFVPTATQWKTDSVSLAALSGQASVRFAFVNINRYGNTLLLDNINIFNAPSVSCTKPTAAFTASPTTVVQGNSVTFTDQSTHSPTAWSWTFTGGTPASATTQVPGAITYNNTGTYTAKLRVSNACGSDSSTITINVVASGGGGLTACDTMSHLIAGDSARLYLSNLWGFLSGHNNYGDLGKAEKYTNPLNKKLSGIRFGFGFAKTNGAGTITARVYDATGPNGGPGAVPLASQSIPISTIASDINAVPYRLTSITFPTPITIPANFFVGFEMTYVAGDTVAVLTTSVFKSASHRWQGWEKQSNGVWYPYDTASPVGWGVGLSNFIFPILCNSSTAPTAAFTANKTTICVGDTVSFTDQSTGGPTGWAWATPGGTPSTSNAQNPKIVYNTAGTYHVTLTVSNAAGNNAITKNGYIVVKDKPNLSAASTPVSCFGGSDGTATITASVAQSPYTYVWSGGGNTATITGKPAGNYLVTVTESSAAACKATASVTISQPLAALAATASATPAFCGNANGTASLTATGGNGGYTYLWSNGATTASISNLIANTYTVTVNDAKNCQVTTSAQVTASTQNLSLIFSNINPTCGNNNGQTSVQINGAPMAGTTYAWSNGATLASLTGLAPNTYTVTVTTALGCTAASATTLINMAGPVLTPTVTDVACRGGSNGSASVSVTGGSGSYSYAWSDGSTTATINNKPAGAYTVTVTDNGTCSSSVTVNIGQPSAVVSVTITTSPSICNGLNGSATATGAGGNGGFTYAWNNGQSTATATNLAAFTYTVTVTDSKGCSAVTTATVTNTNFTLQLNVHTTPANCGQNNGSATASTPSNNVTFKWNNNATSASISNLGVGTYSVTITDPNGCSASASGSVNNPDPPQVTVSSTDVTCYEDNDGSAIATVTGGTGAYSYTWSNGGTAASTANLSAGTITVTVRDAANCETTALATINQPSAVTASATSTPTNFGAATGTATVTATGGAGGYTFAWSNGSNSAIATGLAAGTYSCTVADSKGCTTTISVLVTTKPNDISPVESNIEVRLRPNPATSSVLVNFVAGETADTYIQLYSSLGQQLLTKYIITKKIVNEELDIHHLPAGVYYVRVTHGNYWRVLPMVKE